MSERDALFEAIKTGDEDGVRALVQGDPEAAGARDAAGVSAILVALYHQQPALAVVLADARGDLDVFEAAGMGRTDRLRRLLEGNPALAHGRSSDGFTPLHYAVYFGRPDAARLLVERGAAVSAVAENALKVQPLHSAAAGPAAVRTRVVEMLLAHGADANARHQQGFTALQSAAFSGDQELARALLAHGADLSLRNDQGQTAHDIAVERGNTAIAALLAGL